MMVFFVRVVFVVCFRIVFCCGLGIGLLVICCG